MKSIENDMELPESCEECIYAIKNDFGVKHCLFNKELVVDDLFLVRHDECPLMGIIMEIVMGKGDEK